jgi:transposase InsO family protein
MNNIDVQKCDVYIQSKMHRTNLKSRSQYRSTLPGQIIHSNVCSFEQKSCKGYLYFVTLVDDCSKAVTLYPMKSKANTFQCFKLFHAAFEKSGAHKILSICSDNGGEYLSNKFGTYLAKAGISHDPGPPHSPESNRATEQTNQTINNLL